MGRVPRTDDCVLAGEAAGEEVVKRDYEVQRLNAQRDWVAWDSGNMHSKRAAISLMRERRRFYGGEWRVTVVVATSSGKGRK